MIHFVDINDWTIIFFKVYFYYDNTRYLWWTLGTQKPFRPQSYGTWKSIYPRVVHSPSCVTWPRWFLQVTRVCGPAPPVNSWWRKRITRSCTSKKRWEWVVCCKLSTSDGEVWKVRTQHRMGRDQGVKKVCIVMLIPINVRLGGGRENVSLMCIRAMRGRENFRSNLKLFLNFGLGKLGFIVISLSFCPSFHLSVRDHLSRHISRPLAQSASPAECI